MRRSLLVLFTLATCSASASAPAAPLPVDTRVRAVNWLEGNQNKDGGWGAGAWGGENASAASDVATSSLAVLALMRDGLGVHGGAIARGVSYVVDVVDRSPAAGPKLLGPEGTQPQYKLGQNVDTHMAELMLGEVSGRLDDATNRRVLAALDKVIGKVQSAQQADGSFDSQGWAPVLSHSIAAMSLVTAKEKGVKVDDRVLDRADSYQAAKVSGGTISTADGAGVPLYEVASTMRQASQSEARGRSEMKSAGGYAQGQVATNSDALMQGFGSVGGEEMLSYMMISDTLAEKGGRDFDDWNRKVSTSLSATQNADGSWSGHHCITSRTFTTAAAILTLTAGNETQTYRPVPTEQASSGGSDSFWSW